MNPRRSKKPKMEQVATEAQKLKALTDLVADRLTRGFSLFHWIATLHPMLEEHPLFEKRRLAIFCIKNACTEATIMSIRDLDDFFDPKKRRPDDLRATDFYGYRTEGRFLSDDERTSINKRVAHLTTLTIQTESCTWDTAKLLGKAVRAVLHLLAHVEGGLGPDHPDAKSVQNVRVAFESGLHDLEQLAIKERYAKGNA